jgi:hypothetical protein
MAVAQSLPPQLLPACGDVVPRHLHPNLVHYQARVLHLIISTKLRSAGNTLQSQTVELLEIRRCLPGV